MTQAGFPDPVNPSEDIDQVRDRRAFTLLRVAALGVVIRLLIVTIEFLSYWRLNYSVLLVDAIASCADILTSLTIIFAIHLARRPPDEDHPFGHGRYEPLAGLQLGLLIIFLGIGLAAQQFVAAIQHPAAGNILMITAAIPMGAAFLLEICYQILVRRARSNHSPVLLAEAYHYRVDAFTSLLAAAGIGIAAFAPNYSHLIDHVFAILLAVVMMFLGYVAAKENLHQLTDRLPDLQWFQRVRAATESVTGILAVEKVRIQIAGPDAHVDIDIEVNPQCTVDDAHIIAQHVRASIQSDWPAVREVVVHVEPFYANDH